MSEQEHKLRVKADTSDAQTQMRKLGATITGSMVKSQIAIQAVSKALAFAKQTMSAIIENALEYERTNIRLAASLRNAGVQANFVQDALNAQSTALQDLTGVSDETIRKMQALALNLGVGFDRVDDFTRAAIRLSNTFDMDLNSAARVLGQTLSGTGATLTRYIGSVRDLTKEQLEAGGAIDLVNNGLSENLTILTHGGVGETVGLTRAWEDLTEAIGIGVVNFGQATGIMRDLNDEFVVMAEMIKEDGFFDAIVSNFFLSGTSEMKQFAENIRKFRQLDAESRRLQLAEEAANRGPRRLPGGAGAKPKKKTGPDPIRGDLLDFVASEFARQDFQTEFDAAVQARIDAREREQKIANEMGDDAVRLFLENEEKKTKAVREQEAFRTQMGREAFGAMQSNAQMTTRILIQAFKSWTEGAEVSAQAMLKSWLWQTGAQLVSLGTMWGFRAIADAIWGDKLKAKAGGAAATAATAAGLQMMAGSLVIRENPIGGASVQSLSGGSGARGISGGGAGAGGSVGGGGGFRGGFGGDGARPIVININGSMTNEETMLALRRAMKDFNDRGL